MVNVFDSGDKPFFKWMKENPQGFVLNVKRPENSDYAFFHKSHCHHIASPIRGSRPNPYTTRNYFKVCSKNAADLLDWIKINRKKAIDNTGTCRDCNPQIDLTLLKNLFPDEIVNYVYSEGSKKEINVNRYERDPQARKKCLDYYGYECRVCEMSFEERYGKIGKSFIHVHHLKPLSEIDKEYNIDPIRDLRPVCPNCHAMIHRKNPPFSIEKIKTIIKER